MAREWIPAFAGTGTACAGTTSLLRRDPEARVALDIGEAAGEALAFRILERRGARTGDGVDSLRQRNRAREHGPDHALLDEREVAAAALVRVAIALDEPRAFGDLERELDRLRGGLLDQPEPCRHRGLL